MRRGFDFPDTNFAPNLDIVERENDIQVKIEIPGIVPEDVEVKVHDNILIVSGKRHFEKEESNETWLRRESTYGSFERRVTLPKGIDSDTVSASYNLGVLSVSIPKPEKAIPKKVEVKR